MWFRTLLALALGAGTCCVGLGADIPGSTRALTLRECLEMALARNLDIQIGHVQADIAGYNLAGAYGVYIPAFAFRARHDFVSQPANFDPQKENLDQPYELNSDLLGPGLTGRLPMGFSYDLGAYTREDNAVTDFSHNLEARPNYPPDGLRHTNNYFTEMRLDVQQKLLKDFWIDADRQTIQLRRKDVKISEQLVRFQVMKTVLAVALSYYDLAAARERIQVQEKALELRQQLVNETRRRVELGDLPALDNEQAETELQNTLTALSLAREAFLTEENLLKGLISDDVKEWVEVTIQAADPLLVMPTGLNRSASFQSAMANRPDLLQARLAVEKSAVIVSYRKNQLLPNLDLVGRYGGLGVDDTPGGSIDTALGLHHPEYFYGAVLSFPLSLSAEKGNYRASKAAKQLAELQLKKAEQEILVQVADLILRAQARMDQVTSTRKARAYAEAALAAEQKKLANGLTTSFVVLQLQETLTAARNAELVSIADYNKIHTQLAFAEGSILERFRLSFR